MYWAGKALAAATKAAMANERIVIELGWLILED